jgi:hypothetical protein
VADGTDGQKRFAAGALTNLACECPVSQTAIVEAGGIPPLVALVADGTDGQKEGAVRTLLTLYRHEGHSTKLTPIIQENGRFLSALRRFARTTNESKFAEELLEWVTEAMAEAEATAEAAAAALLAEEEAEASAKAAKVAAASKKKAKRKERKRVAAHTTHATATATATLPPTPLPPHEATPAPQSPPSSAAGQVQSADVGRQLLLQSVGGGAARIHVEKPALQDETRDETMDATPARRTKRETELEAELESIREQCICPITFEPMRDPVTAADGLSYERSAIEEWLAKKTTSPYTNEPLKNKSLLPNIALRALARQLFPDGE